MRKRLWLIVGGFVALLLLAALVLPFLIDANVFRPAIENRLQAALGRRITIGDLNLSVLRGHLRAGTISISDDPAFSSAPFVRAESLDVGIELIPLIFSRDLRIRSITLQQPELALLRSANGRWNFSSLGQGAAQKPQSAKAQASGTPAFSVASSNLSRSGRTFFS